MNDRLAFCDICEEAYWEGNAELHEHPKERAAERQFLGIEQKGPPTGFFLRPAGEAVYTRADAIRDGRPMRFMAKGKMRTTDKA